tara:strand:+ start:160 stop:780 length:621 start_codon:yes stop_codon:yes gene_type:complete
MKYSPKLFVISAPSGAGKTTLVKSLIKRNKNIKYSISFTTRAPRKNEKEGIDYFFVTLNEFNKLKNKNEFIEFAEVFNNFYATSKSQIKNIIENGDHVVLEIDWQGAQQVRNSMPECVSIFIMPPSQSILRQRLESRATDDDDTISLRTQEAREDMRHWSEFDYCVINDDLNTAKEELESIFLDKNNLNNTKNSKLIKKIHKILYR